MTLAREIKPTAVNCRLETRGQELLVVLLGCLAVAGSRKLRRTVEIQPVSGEG